MTVTDLGTQRDTWRAAIEILVQREVTSARPDNPGAYAGSVRSRLLNATRDHARALLEDTTLTPEQLAEALDDTPELAPPRPTIRHVRDRHCCRTCNSENGGGWLDVERNPDGTLPLAVPCPNCAEDRHRAHVLTYGRNT